MTRLVLLATIALLVLTATGCGGGTEPSAQRRQTTQAGKASGQAAARAPRPRQLTDVHDIGQLRAMFNARSGEPRLILLVSPT